MQAEGQDKKDSARSRVKRQKTVCLSVLSYRRAESGRGTPVGAFGLGGRRRGNSSLKLGVRAGRGRIMCRYRHKTHNSQDSAMVVVAMGLFCRFLRIWLTAIVINYSCVLMMSKV